MNGLIYLACLCLGPLACSKQLPESSLVGFGVSPLYDWSTAGLTRIELGGRCHYVILKWMLGRTKAKH